MIYPPSRGCNSIFSRLRRLRCRDASALALACIYPPSRGCNSILFRLRSTIMRCRDASALALACFAGLALARFPRFSASRSLGSPGLAVRDPLAAPPGSFSDTEKKACAHPVGRRNWLNICVLLMVAGKAPCHRSNTNKTTTPNQQNKKTTTENQNPETKKNKTKHQKQQKPKTTKNQKQTK